MATRRLVSKDKFTAAIKHARRLGFNYQEIQDIFQEVWTREMFKEEYGERLKGDQG